MIEEERENDAVQGKSKAKKKKKWKKIIKSDYKIEE